MIDDIPLDPTDDQFLEIWQYMQHEDILGQYCLSEAVKNACRAGHFDGKRIATLMKKVPFAEIPRFRQEVEMIAKSFKEDDIQWGKEWGNLSLDLFGIPIVGEPAAIEVMTEAPDAGRLLVDAGYGSDYFAAGSHCMVLPVPLSLDDLSNVGPQQLYELAKAMATRLREPDGGMTEIRGILASMRTGPRAETSRGRILEADVLIGAQMRFDTEFFGAGPDCLMYEAVGGYKEEKAQARREWRKLVDPFARSHRLFITPPVRWKSVRSTLADLRLTHAIFEAVTFGGHAADGVDRDKIELSFVPQDDGIEIRVFYEDDYKMSMPVSIDLLPDCLDTFIEVLHQTYDVRPHDPNDDSRPRLQ
jgi:hypothetical protein